MTLNNSIKLEQKHLLSQTQIQSLEMLAMCNMDLKEFLENEYNENPLLELQYSADERSSGYQKVAKSENEVERPWEHLPYYDTEAVEEYLYEQIEIGVVNEKNKDIYRFLIQNIDENGFYSLSEEETTRILQRKPEEIQKCLYYLQRLEPIGIFQKNLQESLIYQLKFHGIEDEVLNQIIFENLEEIGNSKLSVITKKFGITTECARKYKTLISTLNPKPLSGYSETKTTEYIVPDVIITVSDTGVETELNDHWIGNYSLNDYYLKMIEGNNDPQLKEYFQKKLERARLVIKAIEQRRSTVLAITNLIIHKQRKFFVEKGVLRPMTMKEVAEELGISTSTVSRAVGDKYLEYPGGVILYRKLFTMKVAEGQDGKGCSAQEIKKVITKLITEEDRNNPLSDNELVTCLKEKGMNISRRGIAKYRSQLGIPGSFERKKDKNTYNRN